MVTSAVGYSSYISLACGVFGQAGSWLVTFNLIWIFNLFYGLAALFLAESLKGLFHLILPIELLAVRIAIVMSSNIAFWIS